MLTIGIILIGVIAAAAFLFAVSRLFSPNSLETTDGDIVSSAADVGHDGGGDCGGGD